jgi:hypothetical protein
MVLKGKKYADLPVLKGKNPQFLGEKDPQLLGLHYWEKLDKVEASS